MGWLKGVGISGTESCAGAAAGLRTAKMQLWTIDRGGKIWQCPLMAVSASVTFSGLSYCQITSLTLYTFPFWPSFYLYHLSSKVHNIFLTLVCEDNGMNGLPSNPKWSNVISFLSIPWKSASGASTSWILMVYQKTAAQMMVVILIDWYPIRLRHIIATHSCFPYFQCKSDKNSNVTHIMGEMLLSMLSLLIRIPAAIWYWKIRKIESASFTIGET